MCFAVRQGNLILLIQAFFFSEIKLWGISFYSASLSGNAKVVSFIFQLFIVCILPHIKLKLSLHILSDCGRPFMLLST